MCSYNKENVHESSGKQVIKFTLGKSRSLCDSRETHWSLLPGTTVVWVSVPDLRNITQFSDPRAPSAENLGLTDGEQQSWQPYLDIWWVSYSIWSGLHWWDAPAPPKAFASQGSFSSQRLPLNHDSILGSRSGHIKSIWPRLIWNYQCLLPAWLLLPLALLTSILAGLIILWDSRQDETFKARISSGHFTSELSQGPHSPRVLTTLCKTLLLLAPSRLSQHRRSVLL